MTNRHHSGPTVAALNNGGGNRKDYGPKGCAGFVVVPVLAVVSLLARQPKWGSKGMQRAIRKHDRRFAKKHGSVYGKPPRKGCWLFSLMLLAPILALLVGCHTDSHVPAPTEGPGPVPAPAPPAGE